MFCESNFSVFIQSPSGDRKTGYKDTNLKIPWDQNQGDQSEHSSFSQKLKKIITTFSKNILFKTRHFKYYQSNKRKKKPLFEMSELNTIQFNITYSSDYSLYWLFMKELHNPAQNTCGASKAESCSILSNLRVQNVSIHHFILLVLCIIIYCIL